MLGAGPVPEVSGEHIKGTVHSEVILHLFVSHFVLQVTVSQQEGIPPGATTLEACGEHLLKHHETTEEKHDTPPSCLCGGIQVTRKNTVFSVSTVCSHLYGRLA